MEVPGSTRNEQIRSALDEQLHCYLNAAGDEFEYQSLDLPKDWSKEQKDSAQMEHRAAEEARILQELTRKRACRWFFQNVPSHSAQEGVTLQDREIDHRETAKTTFLATLAGGALAILGSILVNLLG
jgi:hypothetical protein